MFVCRVVSRTSRNVCRSYRFLAASQSSQHIPSRIRQSPDTLIPVPINLLHLTINASSNLRALFSSTADSTKASEEAKGLGSEVDFSRDGREFVVENFVKDLLDLVDDLRRASFLGKDKFSTIEASKGSDGADASKGLDGAVQLLKKLHDGLEVAEKKIAEVLKKCDEFDPEQEPCGPDRDGAILELQNFAKSLADVGNNLERSSLVAKENVSNIDAFKESNEALPILKTVLEAVETTEKQLDKIFENIGLGKIISKQELYNPERHDPLIQFPVSSQAPGTIIAVLKAGYTLHGRVYRRARVATIREVTDEDRAEEEALNAGMMNYEDYGDDKDGVPQRPGSGFFSFNTK